MGVEYSLICDNCGGLFHSADGFPKPQYCFNCLAAFKAGYDKALTQLAGVTEECKQMGKQEVVEWIEQQNHHDNVARHPQGYYQFGGLEWQAKLKEWKCLPINR